VTFTNEPERRGISTLGIMLIETGSFADFYQMQEQIQLILNMGKLTNV
jgi:hypothetical protein